MVPVKHIDTLIIGGGISGLSAARRLHEVGIDFVLVTDRLGGRMFHSEDATMNFGATYINEDYKEVSQFVGKGKRFRISEVFTGNEQGINPFLHPRNIKYAFPATRLYLMLRRLRNELRDFRKKAEYTPQHILINDYPFMQKLARTNASDFIKIYNLQSLNDSYFRYVFWATCFADIKEASALFYLGVLFPLVVKTYMADFSNAYEKLTEGILDNIIFGKVSQVSRSMDSLFRVIVNGRQDILAKHVIFATPYHNTCNIYPVPRSHYLKPATVIYVRGKKKPQYEGKQFILFDPKESSVGLIWSQYGEKDLLFCLHAEPRLDQFYLEYEILKKVEWKTAVVLSNKEWLPMNFEPNLYIAGDHNICGLEDSYLSGRCAANLIIEKSRHEGI